MTQQTFVLQVVWEEGWGGEWVRDRGRGGASK